jgi:hypothetical protein
MTKGIWTGTCAAAIGLATAVAFAQTPAPQQNQKSNTDQRITVTGCLKAATPAAGETSGATGTSGTAGAAGAAATGTTGSAADPANEKFLLTEAAVSTGDSAGSSASGATSAAGAAASSAPTESAASNGAAAKTYRLIANPTALSPHVGKKLELTGTVQNTVAAPSAAAGPEASAPALKVESGKVVAASCSEK